jgi:hypothetical protein
MVRMENRNPSSRGQGRALRLTFSYEGARISLVDRQVVDRPTQPSAPLLEPRPRDAGQSGAGAGSERAAEQERKPRGQSGFWIELHGRQGRALYRLVMSNPIAFRAEVPDEGGGFTNVTVENPRGQFFVLVPNLPDAESVVVFSSPLGPEARPGPAEPVARFPLRTRKEG